jgi:nucleoside-diphosphate-sugar epimerase
MEVLIYGHKGWIGQQVVDLLKQQSKSEVSKVLLGEARADDIEAVRLEIELTQPTHVMAFIGRTHGTIGDKEYKTIDYLEQPGKLTENVRDNLFSPVALALLAREYDIHFTYMGTGCIFEYDDDHPFPTSNSHSKKVFHAMKDVKASQFDPTTTMGFTEDDIPNFFGSSYSVVKGYTDRLMHLFEDSVLNVRIRMPITGTVNSRNFITKIVNYPKVCSIPNSMTVLPSLLPVMIDMAKKRTTGTINLINPGLISHNEILQMYKEIVDPNFKWVNFTLEEQAQILAAGRSNNYLDTNKLTTMYPRVPTIHEAVKACLKDMKDHLSQPQKSGR